MGPICRVVNYVSSEHLVNWLSFLQFIKKHKDRDFKDMDLDLDHFLNLEQLIPAGFTVAKGSIF